MKIVQIFSTSVDAVCAVNAFNRCFMLLLVLVLHFVCTDAQIRLKVLSCVSFAAKSTVAYQAGKHLIEV